MSQQDHKISSMVSLISSLAEESQQNHDMRGGFIPSLAPPLVAVASSPPSLSRNNLIHVSDDEEEEDSDSETESESESESSDIESDAGSDEKSDSDVKTITILSEDLAKEDIIFEENDNAHENEDNENDNNENDNNENDNNENDDEDDNSLFEMDELEPDSIVQESAATNSHEEVKTIYLDEPSVDEITDFSIFKTINISSLDESTTNGDNNHSDNNNGDNTNTTKVFETSDYKKMSITKLREVISKQGVSDASKLKKSDILKMLGVE
jgi:hypothetical protein